VAEMTRRGQDWFWSENWQAGEREAEADLAGGRMREFENAEEAIRFLKRSCANKDERDDGPDTGRHQI